MKKTEQVSLYIPAGNVTSLATIVKGIREAEQELQVPTTTLDTFISKNSIKKVDLLKIDVERAEPMVLQGARNVIRRDKPLVICEVLDGGPMEFLEQFLSAFGYNYYWITDKGLIQKDAIEADGTYKYENYLFCKKGKLKETNSTVANEPL